MCKYCEEDAFIFEKTLTEAKYLFSEQVLYEMTYGVFIDRGYLRFVDKDDCNCIESGLKIKINFCLWCGRRLEE